MDWDRRYREQARWTRELRTYLFERAGWSRASRVLEVGCGTGAILSDLAPRHLDPTQARPAHRPRVFGIDIDVAALRLCAANAPVAHLLSADARNLPFHNQSFDIAFCHFVLLWVSDPVATLREMRRVVISGGQILALAEPDYQHRIDWPVEVAEAAAMQNRSLEFQGADVSIGVRLPKLFNEAGIGIIESGPLTPEPAGPVTWSRQDLEWLVMESDLLKVLPPERVEEYRIRDSRARREGVRRTHVPTYFAWGQV